MDPGCGEDKKKRKARPKANVDDLATRLIKSNAGEDYQEVCIKNVFDRIRFESMGGTRPQIPDPDISISLPSKLASNLKGMNISQLLPTQRYTLPLLVDQDIDVFVGAATGHGKTLAFLIPIAVGLMRCLPRDISSCRRPLALVIANTQVLQIQTFGVCQSLVAGTGLRVALVCGQTAMVDQKKHIEKGCDIVIATTGRLLQFLQEKELSLEDLQYYVYDEADKMTQGGAFKEAVADIDKFIPRETKENLRSCFFTATLDAMSSFDNMYRQDKFCTVRVPGNPLITHKIIPLNMEQDNDKEKSLILMRLLQRDLEIQGRTIKDKSKEPYTKKTVVFVSLKQKCNFLAAYLRMYGFSVGVANSDLSLQMRNSIIKKFCDGEIQALIATDSMARGHDIPDVTHVINYDMSDNALDTFKHRAGRTARIGHKGTCTTLLSRTQFLLFDDPSISEFEPRRKRATEFAHYLVLECGQKIPKCLQKPALNALKDELMSWGIEDEPYDYMLKMGIVVYEKEEGEGREIPSSPSSPSPSSPSLTRSVEHDQKRKMQRSKVPLIDDDGTPIFDASETEREDGDDDDDCGGITIDESEFDENDYFFGDDDYGTDSDSDAPKANDSSETLVEDDPSRPIDMRWTDDEDEDDVDEETQEARLDALKKDYERQELERRDNKWSDDEDDHEKDDEEGGNDEDVD